jgi:beta-lactamase regulating signal transducer with metallopeptidase domain
MSELFRAVAVMSITGTCLAALLFALKPIIKNRLSKAVQYYMWLIALAMLLVPVSRLVVLPEQSSLPLAVTPERAVTQYVITSEEELDRVGGIPVSQNANQNSMEYIQQSQSPISAVISVFTIFYPLGVLMVLGYYIAGFAVFAGYFSRRNIPAPEKEYELLKELRGKGGVPKLYRSPLASTPMLIGLLRPKIILPEREYSDAQLHAILTHELMHLRRMDILVRWLSVIACAVHWFNPIVWLVRREIDRVCELSCDEAVIKNLDPKGRQRYGDTLIYAAADCKTPRVVITTTMCEEKRNLKERLSAIQNAEKSKNHAKQKARGFGDYHLGAARCRIDRLRRVFGRRKQSRRFHCASRNAPKICFG